MLAQQRTIIQLVELVNVLHSDPSHVLAALQCTHVGYAGAAAHHHSACGAGQRAA
jgi:predicted transcriptional regulator with HTH domain